MEYKHIAEKSLLVVAKSLVEPIPYNIDDCIDGIRFIVEFAGQDDNVRVITATVLDSDWMPDTEAGKAFLKKVSEAVHYRNIEFRELLEQAVQIRKDRYGY